MSRLVLIVLAAAGSLALAGGVQAAQPSFYATYSPNCTFTWTGDNSASVTSVPPGTYDVVITTPFAFGNGNASCLYVQFHLTGPGLDLGTDLSGAMIELAPLLEGEHDFTAFAASDDSDEVVDAGPEPDLAAQELVEASDDAPGASADAADARAFRIKSAVDST